MAKRALHASDTQTAKHIAQSAVHAHNGANVFLPRNMFTAGSDGVTDAGKGVLLNSSGLIDPFMVSEVETLTINHPTASPRVKFQQNAVERAQIQYSAGGDELQFYTVDAAINFTHRMAISGEVNITKIFLSPYSSSDTASIYLTGGGNAQGLVLGAFYTWLAGAAIQMYGANHATLPGHFYLRYGDYTAAKPSGTHLRIQLLDNSSLTTALTCDDDANVNIPRILIAGTDITPSTFMARGIMINQAAADNHFWQAHSSDVGHGMTIQVETTCFGFMKKAVALTGGLAIFGLTEAVIGLNLIGVATNDNTTLGAGANAPILLKARKKDGTTWGAVGANANIVVMASHSDEVWGCNVDGKVWQTGLLTNAGGGTDTTLGITRYMVNSSYMTTYRHKEEVSISGTAASNKWDFSLCDGTSTGFISILRLRSTGIEITGDIIMADASPAIEPDTDAKTMSIKSSSTGLAGATISLYSAGTASLKGNMYLDFGDYTAVAPAAASLNIRSLDNGSATAKIVVDAQGVHMALRSGANQVAAGAVAGELWHDTDDNIVKMGV